MKLMPGSLTRSRKDGPLEGLQAFHRLFFEPVTTELLFMAYKIYVTEINKGYLTFDSLKELNEFKEGDMELNNVKWTHCDSEFSDKG